MSKKLYVGNLAYGVTEEDLTNTFGTIGDCSSANVVRDQYSGTSRGFGFVEMATEEGAQEAIKKLNETELKGRNIVVQEARPRKEARRTPFGGRGSGGRKRF
jgi:RNA recognition motif-containing protein